MDASRSWDHTNMSTDELVDFEESLAEAQVFRKLSNHFGNPWNMPQLVEEDHSMQNVWILKHIIPKNSGQIMPKNLPERLLPFRGVQQSPYESVYCVIAYRETRISVPLEDARVNRLSLAPTRLFSELETAQEALYVMHDDRFGIDLKLGFPLFLGAR